MALPGTIGPSRADVERTVEKMLFERFGVLHHHRIAGVVESEAGGVPAGTVLATARATAPAGYLLCDGAAVSRTEFKTLFDAIGTAFGAGDDSTTFNIPDLRSRAPIGVDGGANRVIFQANTLGGSSGVEVHALTIAQLPAHTHTIGDQPANTQGGSNQLRLNGQNTGQGVVSGSTGGGTGHQNMQPYQVVNYMVKT